MNTKLTLTIEQSVIEKAKKYAKNKERSLSDLIENYLKSLTNLEEKTVEEIGEILGISVNTVKKHKKEAYQYIRKILSPDIFILFCLLFHPKD